MRSALLLGALLAAVPPQKAPVLPSLGETVEVSIVNVDVFVTDRDGNRVRGLTRDDFEIYDGKARQPISNFAEYSSAPAQPDPSTDARDDIQPQKRTVVVFLEQMRLASFEAEPFIGGIKKSLHSIIRPGDAASVVLWSRGTAARIDFTDDLTKIDEALDSAARHFVGVEIDDDRLARDLVDEAKQFEDEAAAMAASKGLTYARIEDGTEATKALIRTRAMADMHARVTAISAAVSSMAGVDGKKVLLLVPRTLGELVGVPNEDVRVDALDKFKWGTERLMKPVLENANASGVTIYPLYAPRIRSGLPDASSDAAPDPTRESLRWLNETFSFEKIAEKTGGLFAMSPVEAVKLLPRIEEDVTDYYSLAFRGEGAKGDRVRDIVVKTKNPNLVVRSRRQYVEKSDATRMRDRVAAALTLMPAHGFDITAKTGQIVKSRSRETVPVSIRIPIRSLDVIPDGARHAGAFSVFIAAGSSEGALSEIVQKTQPFQLEDMQKARDGYFTYSLDVVVEKKMDRLAVGVLDEVSKEFALLRVPFDGR